MPDPPRLQTTARVVVLDPDGRALLLGARLVDPTAPPGGVVFWYIPGGGVEEGESLRGAAVRELFEETGLVVEPAALEGPVWLGRFVATLDGVEYDSRDTYFVLRGVVHEVDVSGRTELEQLADEPHRWWTADEVAASAEEFAPRELASLLPELTGPPWSGPPRIVA